MEALYYTASEYKVVFTSVHVISVICAMGAALMSDVLFSFYSHDKKLSRTEQTTLNYLSTIVWIGLIVVILSGVGIFFSHVEGYLDSTKFLAKMTIMVVLLINGYILHRYISTFMQRKGFLSSKSDRKKRMLSFVCGAVSVVSWFWVCILGMMESVHAVYSHLIAFYISMVCVAGIVALRIEQRKFE